MLLTPWGLGGSVRGSGEELSFEEHPYTTLQPVSLDLAQLTIEHFATVSRS